MAQLAGSAGELEQLVGQAVTALQFQDLVSQLLGHVVGRMDGMQRALESFAGFAQAAGNTRGSADLIQLRLLAERVQTELNALATQADRNPVPQPAAAGGDVQLF
jgi:methyl-accepting chemotaxis protein